MKYAIIILERSGAGLGFVADTARPGHLVGTARAARWDTPDDARAAALRLTLPLGHRAAVAHVTDNNIILSTEDPIPPATNTGDKKGKKR